MPRSPSHNKGAAKDDGDKSVFEHVVGVSYLHFGQRVTDAYSPRFMLLEELLAEDALESVSKALELIESEADD